MKNKVTIIGFGATSQALAATLSLRGLDVLLAFPDIAEAAAEVKTQYDAIREKGGVLIRGNGERGVGSPQITTDMAVALDHARAVIISTVAKYHEPVARALIPHLKDGAAFLIGPGNAGSIVFRNIFKQAGVSARVYVAETQGNFCSARITGKAEVVSANPLGVKKIAAYPGADTAAVQKVFEGILETEALANVLETTLNSPNVVSHLAATLLNTSKIDDMGKKFHLFLHGLTDTVMKGMQASANEWDAVMKALGIWQRPYSHEDMEHIRAYDQYPELDVFRSLSGPDSLTHRYVSEDAGGGVTLLVSLARLINVPVPFTEALIAIAGALNGADYYANGCNLDNLGFEGKTIEEIKGILLHG